MTYIQAIILGLIQGLAEFLPISSSGHLALLQHFFGVEGDKVLLFSVMLGILPASGAYDIGHSRDHTRELLEQGLQPDGVFCQSDHIALGVCQAIRDAGLRIPQDIAVVGFDNYDFARFVSPALSTIDQPLEQIGGVAFAQLQRMIDGQAIRDRSVLLEAKLVTRHSA